MNLRKLLNHLGLYAACLLSGGLQPSLDAAGELARGLVGVERFDVAWRRAWPAIVPPGLRCLLRECAPVAPACPNH